MKVLFLGNQINFQIIFFEIINMFGRINWCSLFRYTRITFCNDLGTFKLCNITYFVLHDELDGICSQEISWYQ